MYVRLPTRFEEASMESLDPRQMAEVIGYADSVVDRVKSGLGLLLMGKPGVGKTWAMAALTRHWISTALEMGLNQSHEFATSPDMFDRLLSFDKPRDRYRGQSWKQTYRSVPWLVINDLGKEDRTGAQQERVAAALGRLLRARSEEKLLVHITSNLTLEIMQQVYGESIMSLMSEILLPVEITGVDRRV